MLEEFGYVCPNTIEEAFSAMSKARPGQALLLAGGTDLIPELRSKEKKADCLIDLSKLNLNGIKCMNDKVIIGAVTTFRKLARDPIIRNELPILSDCANQIGAVQTRSLATIGGNLCTAAPSADSATLLMCLDAVLRLVSPTQERLVPVEDFFVGPRKTVLQDMEILTEIIVPLVQNRKTNFKKIGRRKTVCLSLINCAAALRIDEKGIIEEARVALGALAPTPMRAMEAEKLLVGKNPSLELFEEAGKIAMNEIKPTTSYRASAEYKRLLTEAVVKRTLEDSLSQFKPLAGKG